MTTSLTGTPTNSFATPAITSAAKSSTAANPTASTDTSALNQNFDQFLTLLTTQLKNQDPTAPMDSAAFTNQLVSFSGVEQQIKANSQLASLVNMSKASQTTLASATLV